jgi:hypothetical protein
MTKYSFLCDHDNNGKPDNLNVDPRDGSDIFRSTSSSLLTEIDQNLPGGSSKVTTKHPDWIKKSDIYTVADCEISVTFLHEGAGYRNTLGYYVYDRNDPPSRFSDIEELIVILPNASLDGSGGKLSSGDTMQLAYTIDSDTSYGGPGGKQKNIMQTATWVFPPGKGIGWVCMSNRWKANGTSGAHVSYGSIMYSSDPILNPENTLAKRDHCVNFQSTSEPDRIVNGFEDIHRDRSYCDHDFNDLVFCVNSNPIEAIDPISYNSTTKQTFKGTILCEDLIDRPKIDYDYNDLTLRYKAVETLNGTKIKNITIELEGLTRGASLNHDFGVVLPGLHNTNAKVYLETCVVSTTPDSSHPVCTTEVTLTGYNLQPSRIIESGETLCIEGTGTYAGSLTVRSGGHVAVRGNAAIFGSVTIDSGATYWKSATTGFTGSLSMNGTLKFYDAVVSTVTTKKNLTPYLSDKLKNKYDYIPIITDTKSFLPNGSIWATNTIAGTDNVAPSWAKLRIIFPGQGVSRSVIGARNFPYNFYLRPYRTEGGPSYLLDSDTEYDDVSDDMRDAGVTKKKKLMILENIVNYQNPFERLPLRYVYHKFIDFCKGDSRYNAWYLPKYTRAGKTYPLANHDAFTDWNQIMDESRDPCTDLYQVMDLNIDGLSKSWNETDMSLLLSKSNYVSSDVLDWDTLDSLQKIEDVIGLLTLYGNCYVKYESLYSDPVVNEPFQVTLTVGDDDVVHGELEGSTVTLYLVNTDSQSDSTIVSV